MNIRFLVITLLLLTSLTTSCFVHDTTVSPEDPEKINGSKTLITETRVLPDFNSVNISTAGEVYVTYGAEQEVTVTADDNVVDYIYTTVSNGKLLIGIKRDVQLNNFTLIVNLTMTDLEELSTSSAGSIIGRNKFKADNVSLYSTSAGSIILELEAYELYSSLSSAGSFFLRGSVENHRAVLSSAGNLLAFDLVTDTTIVTLSSAGNAEVYVNSLLDVTISSVGSLFYKGNPTINQTITSIGRVINAN